MYNLYYIEHHSTKMYINVYLYANIYICISTIYNDCIINFIYYRGNYLWT